MAPEAARAAHRTGRGAVFTISADRPFTDALAAGLLAEAGDEPLALARMLVLLPTRRACRALREGFLRASQGRPLLLPRMMPLGDIDEDPLLLDGEAGLDGALDLPPAIAPLDRQMLLARLILQAGEALDVTTPEQAFRLAGELARLMDETLIEGVALDALDALVPADYARHWEPTLAFLHILRDRWPPLLAERGALEPADRRNRLLAAQAEAWTREPPDHPVIAAGTTGSIPATARLLQVIAGLPRGRIVLPGLDTHVDDATWTEIRREETHPQYGLARLLDRLGIARTDVAAWPRAERPPATARPSTPARARLVAELFRPAATSAAWVDLAGRLDEGALAGLRRIEARTQAEEAAAIAVLLREALETPGRTAALVTPDRGLARRVAAELARWDLAVDDSAGRPLTTTPPAVFLRLTMEAIASQLQPTALLALLKHPFAALGLAPADTRAAARGLDKFVLRGVRPAPGLDGLDAALRAETAERAAKGRTIPPAWADLARRLRAALDPLERLWNGGAVEPATFLATLITALEALAADADQTGANRLWAGEDGEALARFLNDLSRALGDLPKLEPHLVPALIGAAMDGVSVRPTWGSHPRLFLWGPLEARLQRADLTILGGLNEGVWPPDAPADAWLSRPMRREVGLPVPERRIGLSAHDFAQALGAPEVVLTRARKVDGQPMEPSRFLVRLGVVLQAAGLAGALDEDRQALSWAARLRLPASGRVPVQPPEPRPKLDLRPKELSVSGVERLRRDPYSVFARHVLRLYKLDDLDLMPGVADRGIAIHEALELFLRAHPPPDQLPADALARLIEAGETAFGRMLDRPALRAFWWPRFTRIAAFVVAEERNRRDAGLSRSLLESEGRLVLSPATGRFAVTAKADRIDVQADGTAVIIDYKTGRPPSPDEVDAGFSPQLPLEALMVASGGFAGLEPTEVAGIAYWRLSGGRPAGEVKIPTKLAMDELLARTGDGVERLIAAFRDEATPYRCKPSPHFAPRYSDYDHLARLGEWRIDPGSDEG